MDREVGEYFTLEGKQYAVVPNLKECERCHGTKNTKDCCDKCAFYVPNGSNLCSKYRKEIGNCCGVNRDDGKSVLFIETKHRHETDFVKYPFSLDKYKENPNCQIRTDKGHAVKILYTDYDRDVYENKKTPIVAIVKDFHGKDLLKCYPVDGKDYANAGLDLHIQKLCTFGYVNLFRTGDWHRKAVASDVYNSKEEAEYYVPEEGRKNYIGAFRIEWEDTVDLSKL